jgi:membrane protein YqaA with SNARE-associated domain
VVYLSLFLTALVAATLFPLSSEALLAGLIYQNYSLLWLWLAATCGNTLGSCLNWYLGAQLLRWQDRPWFPVSPAKLARAQMQFQRYGAASLLLAWLPVVGDPLTLLAGVMRVHFGLFLVLVATGKALRYGVIILVAVQWLGE